MRKNEMETFRRQLLKLEQHETSSVATLEDEAFYRTDGKAVGNLSNNPVEDRAECVSNNECEETTIGLVENADARLSEINAALERIDAGSFGSCEACGQEISTSRLRAAPFVRHCVECARKSQQGQPALPGNL